MKLKTFFLLLSVALNVVLVGKIVSLVLDGVPEIKDGRYGILKENIKIGRFGESSVIFSLPKGLMVRDSSASGMDRFEPNRFRIVITSDQKAYIDYSIDQKEAELKSGEYYSADNRGASGFKSKSAATTK